MQRSLFPDSVNTDGYYAAASDLDLHNLLRHVYLNTRGNSDVF